MKDEASSEGAHLITAYLRSLGGLDGAEQQLRSAEVDARNAERALAKWLMPADMKPGEKIAVWHGDSLFQVELAPRSSFEVGSGQERIDYEPKVTIRSRGKEFHRLFSVA